jgi:hypothetical protein
VTGYTMPDRDGREVVAGDSVTWSPGGAPAEVVEVGPGHAVLDFGAPVGRLTYTVDISAHLTRKART